MHKIVRIGQLRIEANGPLRLILLLGDVVLIWLGLGRPIRLHIRLRLVHGAAVAGCALSHIVIVAIVIRAAIRELLIDPRLRGRA